MASAYGGEEMNRLYFYRFVQSFASQSTVSTRAKKTPTYATEGLEDPYEGLSQQEAIAKKFSREHVLKAYLPKFVERNWEQWWRDERIYVANPDNVLSGRKKPYVMCLPPPNITGYLHIGHGLTVAIEDSLARRKRMQGYEVLYLPGTDHAGIATHSVVEKNLMKVEGKTRWNLGRDLFVERVWEWKEKHGNQIIEQLRRLGGSFDYTRLRFTMDDMLSQAVKEAFVRFYDEGLIYRSNRLVNWSCKLLTAISDVELEHLELTGPTKLAVPGHTGYYEFGVLINFEYKIRDDPSGRGIVVATTRIETMLGDVAVAVHPDDERYKDLHGKELVHPFIPDRKMHVITDAVLVDMNLGTGAVKITPAHDPNDFNCGLRHHLEQINIFNDDGTINDNGGSYAGLKRYDARKKIIEDLKSLGLLRGKTPNPMVLSICQRSKDIVEPLLRPEWYVRADEISKRMVEVVKNGELKIFPEEFENVWFQWLENPRDWCISRQLWWGHRIPAYLVHVKGSSTQPDTNNENDWVVGRDEAEALERASKKLGVPKEQIELREDEDVLDTWFSSGLFPFSTMGWPEKDHPDLRAFFPNEILETGHDILFFWVARMVMMSLLLTNELPFKEVFLHPIIRDSEGKKMSKSSGNVIDPLEIIDGCALQRLLDKLYEGNLEKKELERAEALKRKDFPDGIAECGSDSLRFGLLAYLMKGRFINLDIKRVIGYREFGNKIWQAVKFALQYVPPEFVYQDFRKEDISKLAFINRWILERLNRAVRSVNERFDTFDFGDATIAFETFFRNELCDIYLEAIKPTFYGSENNALKAETSNTLFTCLDYSLRLLHPMMPFLTEELYHKINDFEGKAKSISLAPYPEYNPAWDEDNDYLEQQLNLINAIAASIRQLASNVSLPNSIRPDIFAVVKNHEFSIQTILEHGHHICTLGKAKKIDLVDNESQIPKGCISTASSPHIVTFVYVKEFVKVDEEIKRLDKRIAEKDTEILHYERELKVGEGKMPEEVKQETISKIALMQSEKQILLSALSQITNML